MAWDESKAWMSGRVSERLYQNLLNDASPQWSSYGTLTANQLLNGNPRQQILQNFVEFDPRKFTLTSTFSF